VKNLPKEKILGANILRARALAGLTQKQLGDLIFCGNAQVCRWEKGISSPTALELKAIADNLSISLDDLYREC
jgi:transcriptional regulator with XRE-family HTH domain